MIILSEVAEKIQAILNGADSETSTLVNPLSGAYNFVVKTTGFHIDSIADNTKQKNFIPVFVDSLGGQFNPVKGIAQGSFSIPIAFYFPVRFKDDFFALGDFLVKAFVGTSLNYGAVSGRAISNISAPQYGEIQNVDFNQFKQWVDSNYQRTIEKMEPYLSMSITLYLTTAADGLLFGNDIKADLKIELPNGDEYTLEDIDWDGASLQSNTQATPEQEEGEAESDSVPFSTTYGQSFKVYPNFNKLAKNETNKYFYRELISAWLSGETQTMKATITFKFGDPEWGLTYTRECFIQSVVTPLEKGQLFSLTITLAKVSSIL